MVQRMVKRTVKLTVALIPIFYIIIALLVPFILNLRFAGGFSLTALVDNASKIKFTIYQALVSSVFTTLLGIPGAYLVGRTKIHPVIKKVFRVMSSIPFVLPGITMAIGFFLVFGNKGLYSHMLRLLGLDVRILYTFTAILLGHVFYNFPLFIRIVGEAWENMDGYLIEAAKVDGASKWQVFWKVEVPVLLPSILRAFFLTYIYTFTSFSVVLILGGIRYSTLEVAIYMYSRITFDFKAASTLMLFQLLFISVLGFFTSIKRESYEKHHYRHLDKFPLWGYFFFGVSALLIFIPLVYSALSGFLDYYGKFSLTNFRMLLSEDLEYLVGTNFKSMVLYTVVIAFTSSLISVIISMFAGYYSSRGRRSYYIVLIPAAMSSVTIAFSYVFVNIPVLLKLILVHSLINLPITFGILEAGWRNVPESIIDAAKVDGADAVRWIWKIAIPLIKNYVFIAFVYSFTISVGETSGTLTLAEPPITTFAAVVFRLMSSRNTEVAMALNTFYFIFVVSLFIIIEMLRKEESA
ncbi:ABC transporter permease [Fervidobacterium islandicum]|uniref:ABC transporter permease n=2 Tax=Fervidobacterium islandicum TaxID=2423 RepID=UPI003CEF1BC2